MTDILLKPLFTGVLLVLFTLQNTAQKSPICHHGVLDLSDFHYDGKKTGAITGEWLFKWKAFDTHIMEDSNAELIHVPGYWKARDGKGFYESQLGYCTYAVRIILPDSGRIWALHLPPIHSAYRLYADGKPLVGVGNPASTASMTPRIRPTIAVFTAVHKEVLLVLEVSNYYFVYGGMLDPIRIGSPESIKTERESSLLISAFLIGSLLIMGLYHLALFILSPKDKSFLFFSMICVFIALRETFGREAIFFEVFPSVSYGIALKVLYAVFPICLIFFVLFFKSLYLGFPALMLRIGVGVSLLYLVVVGVTSNIIYGKGLLAISLLFFAESLFLIVLVTRKTIREPGQNILALTGLLVLMGCFINDVLFEMELVNTYFVLPFGFFVFTLLQSIMLSIRFTNALKTSQTLSVELLRIQSRFEQEILRTRIEIQEETFNNISGEIHDNVGQTLSLAKIQLNILDERNMLDKHLLSEAKSTVGRAMNDLRAIAKSLSSDRVMQLSLFEITKQETNRIEYSGVMHASIVVEGSETELSNEKKVIIFRMIQEALQNVIKHSNARQADITLSYECDQVKVRIKDDGVGFDLSEARSDGLGLQNMINRASLLQGKVAIDSRLNEGTTVTIVCPYG